jgi:uncharacterized phage-associated protein
MTHSLDISNYLVSFFDSKGDPITNKKLQKLLYYTESWHLVYFPEGIINANFEAWVHGPVIPEVYHQFKQFGYSQIKIDYGKANASQFNECVIAKMDIGPDSMELIDEVLLKYGAMSSFQLELLTHSEPPWLTARVGLGPTDHCANVIDKALMKSYYHSLING